MMYRISLTFIALIAISINLLAQSDISKSRWKTEDITIDGNDKEWTKPLNFYDDKSGLFFAISNDNDRLYFAFSLKDEMKMRKLMNAGWSVELSSKEKRKKFDVSLIFPAINLMGMENKKPGSNFERKVPGNPFIKAYQMQFSTVEAKGFQSGSTEISLNNPDGVDVVVGADSAQHLVFEIAIPLNELLSKGSMCLNELIVLNVTVNALDRPSAGVGEGSPGRKSGGGMSGNSMSGGGMRGGGMSGMGGGRSKGGMSRGGDYAGNGFGNRSALFDKVSFKQKFTLVMK
ncbi:MAG: hypothetical protein WCL21_00305 [Mariniphaga sp.]